MLRDSVDELVLELESVEFLIEVVDMHDFL
jgi:hypothetical protein